MPVAPLRRAAEVLVCAVASLSCVPAVATNFSDQWWTPGQPGWGAAIQQQSDVLFVQFLVYGADGSPAWYIASANPQATSAAGHSLYAGDLYRTRGAVVSATFDPAMVSTSKVGTLTFDADSADSAMLTTARSSLGHARLPFARCR